MKKYRFLDNVATADLCFEAEGSNLNELFEAAGLAVCESMVSFKTVTPTIEKKIMIQHHDIERLLFEFLEEIIYVKDAELLLFSKIKVDIHPHEKGHELHAVLWGEKINQSKHELHNDVKAVTMHMFEIKKTTSGWKARVVVDI